MPPARRCVNASVADVHVVGYGNDLLNVDDDLSTDNGLNDAPDGPQLSYEDIAYGGAGRDVLIANIVDDRLLDWLAGLRDGDDLWLVLPRDVDAWWRLRDGLEVVRKDDGWAIVGEGAERARLAFAELDGDRMVYRLADGRVMEPVAAARDE